MAYQNAHSITQSSIVWVSELKLMPTFMTGSPARAKRDG